MGNQEETGLLVKKVTLVETKKTMEATSPVELDKYHIPDPLMTVAETSMNEAHGLRQMNAAGVAHWFCQQGLEDVAGVVATEKLSGPLLAAMGEADVKEVFPEMGTRKALLVLISRLKTATRSLARNSKLWSAKEERATDFKLKKHTNCCGCSMCLGHRMPRDAKKKKTGCFSCKRSAALNTVDLPADSYNLFSARLSITTAKWKDLVDDHPDMNLKTRSYEIGKEAMPQVMLMTDNIDTSLINDVDTVQNVLNQPPNPKPNCCGCCGKLTWEGGHEVGVVRVSYEQMEGNGTTGRTVQLRVPEEDVEKVAGMIMNAMEEAQMVEAVQVSA